jgi:hypothetical protein
MNGNLIIKENFMLVASFVTNRATMGEYCPFK